MLVFKDYRRISPRYTMWLGAQAISIINLRYNEGSSVKGHVFIKAVISRRAYILKCVYRKHCAAYYAYMNMFYILCIRTEVIWSRFLCVFTLHFLIRCISQIITVYRRRRYVCKLALNWDRSEESAPRVDFDSRPAHFFLHVLFSKQLCRWKHGHYILCVEVHLVKKMIKAK